MLDDTRTRTLLCPPADELAAFFGGRLPAPRLDLVASHVEDCDRCAGSLSTLSDAGDSLVVELRKPPEVEPIDPAEAERASSLAVRVGSRLSHPTPPPSTPPAARPGASFGPYELVALLGEGGMGQVWRARHTLMGRDVAIKLIHPGRIGDAAAMGRFQREIQLLARLDHPNIVRAEHADVIDGTLFLVMEYVPGISLADQVYRHGVMAAGQACECIRQAAMALQRAHEKGLVHRDIKPSNLLLTPDGTVKLLDLGLARSAGAPPADELTATGQVMGTFDYMAPEQWDDSHAVDIRADIYSLGCTLYFLLAGRAPFSDPRHASQMSKMKAHALLPPPSLKQLRPDLPDTLIDILDRMLAKAPEDRFGTPGDVAKALEAFQFGGKVTLPPPPVAKARPAADESRTEVVPAPARRRSALPWVLGGVAALTLLGCGGLVMAVATLWMVSPRPNTNRMPQEPSEPITVAVGKGGVLDEVPKGRKDLSAQQARPALVKAFRLTQYREGEGNGELGVLGERAWEARENDSAKIDVALTRRAYCYLVAYNPDGSEQLLYPAKAADAPEPVDSLRYPADLDVNFGFTDGPGLQAFVLITSPKPLPNFPLWKQGKVPMWRKMPPERAWGVWSWANGKVTLHERTQRTEVRPPSVLVLARLAAANVAPYPEVGLAGLPWEAMRRVCRDGPNQYLSDLAESFKAGPDVEVRAWAFAVGPQEK